MPEMHDLVIKPSKEKAMAAPSEPKPWYPSLDLTIKQIPELGDFEAGDYVDFHVRAFIAKKIERAVPPGEKKEPDSVVLEMRKAGVINLTELRQEANEMGISIEDLKDIKAGRKKK